MCASVHFVLSSWHMSHVRFCYLYNSRNFQNILFFGRFGRPIRMKFIQYFWQMSNKLSTSQKKKTESTENNWQTIKKCGEKNNNICRIASRRVFFFMFARKIYSYLIKVNTFSISLFFVNFLAWRKQEIKCFDLLFRPNCLFAFHWKENQKFSFFG